MLDIHYTGEVVAVRGCSLFGYVYDLSQLERFFWVEVIADGDVIGSVRADIDLREYGIDIGRETYCHGFCFVLTTQQRASIDYLEVTIANTSKQLTGKQKLSDFPNLLASTDAIGQVENHGGLKCWGWAYHPLLIARPQYVIFSYNGIELGRVEADVYAPQATEFGLSEEYIGFEWTLPLFFADGKFHHIDVFDSLGNTLVGSPLSVFLPQEGFSQWIAHLPLPDTDKSLLNHLAERYRTSVPLSLDFSMYPAWSAVFYPQHPELSPKKHPHLVDVMIILTGEDGNLDITLQSLYQQSHVAWQVFICGRFSDLLYHDDSRVTSINQTQWQETIRNAITTHPFALHITAGDWLEPHALSLAIEVIEQTNATLVYSDCDIPDVTGKRHPWFKPDWDIDLFLNTTALHDMSLLHSARLVDIDPQLFLEGKAWAAFALVKENNHVQHIPQVLYHRANLNGLYDNLSQSHYWLSRFASNVLTQQTPLEITQILWPLPATLPWVTIIIPTRDQCALLKRCVSTLQQTTYPHIEWIIINNDSTQPETLEYFSTLTSQGVRIVDYAGAFNFSAMNNHAVQSAKGDLICLINNDVECLHEDWLEIMVRELLRPDVGVVGAKLLWDNHLVQHGGVLMGLHGLAGHIGNDWHTDDLGYFGLNQQVRAVDAVTAACLLCRREDYLAIGGLDAVNLAVNFNDVDFCLRIQKLLGKRVIWTPHARLKHLESATRGKEASNAQRARTAREIKYMRNTWAEHLINNKHYNPNLNFDRYSHAGLAFPPR